MDRISTPFLTMEDGVWRERRGFRDGQVRDFGEGGPHRLYRFNTPDQVNLPALTGARTSPACTWARPCQTRRPQRLC
ncbi:hypothetical protein ACFPH9_03910 [Brevundimonas bullata]